MNLRAGLRSARTFFNHEGHEEHEERIIITI
jgi:hypothetical protein